jgi:hypothetical protein
LNCESLHRTRALLGWQKWLFGFGIGFTAITLTSEISFERGRIKDSHFLMRDFPAQFGSFAVLANRLLDWLLLPSPPPSNAQGD